MLHWPRILTPSCHTESENTQGWKAVVAGPSPTRDSTALLRHACSFGLPVNSSLMISTVFNSEFQLGDGYLLVVLSDLRQHPAG